MKKKREEGGGSEGETKLEESYDHKRGCRLDGPKSLLVVVAPCKRSEGGEGCRATLEAREGMVYHDLYLPTCKGSKKAW